LFGGEAVEFDWSVGVSVEQDCGLRQLGQLRSEDSCSFVIDIKGDARQDKAFLGKDGVSWFGERQGRENR
jgi:hypothetical protein